MSKRNNNQKIVAKVYTLEFEKIVTSGSHHSGKSSTTRNIMVQSIMLDKFPRKVYIRFNDWYVTIFGLVRKIM